MMVDVGFCKEHCRSKEKQKAQEERPRIGNAAAQGLHLYKVLVEMVDEIGASLVGGRIRNREGCFIGQLEGKIMVVSRLAD